MLSSLKDTSKLIPYGFFGFEPDRTILDTTRSGESGAYEACHAYWPKDISAYDLPPCVHSIQSDRVRLGQGVVKFKAQTPEQ